MSILRINCIILHYSRLISLNIHCWLKSSIAVLFFFCNESILFIMLQIMYTSYPQYNLYLYPVRQSSFYIDRLCLIRSLRFVSPNKAHTVMILRKNNRVGIIVNTKQLKRFIEIFSFDYESYENIIPV